jgi:hypothetical protein
MWDKVHSNVGRRADKSAAGTAVRHLMQPITTSSA